MIKREEFVPGEVVIVKQGSDSFLALVVEEEFWLEKMHLQEPGYVCDHPKVIPLRILGSRIGKVVKRDPDEPNGDGINYYLPSNRAGHIEIMELNDELIKHLDILPCSDDAQGRYLKTALVDLRILKKYLTESLAGFKYTRGEHTSDFLLMLHRAVPKPSKEE